MKKFSNLIVLLLLMSSINMLAQQNFSVLKSNMNRLFVDFEVKDNKNPDSLLLNSINLDSYESLRQTNQRITITDNSTGYILILYSQKETDKNRSKKEPLQKFQRVANNNVKAIK